MFVNGCVSWVPTLSPGLASYWSQLAHGQTVDPTLGQQGLSGKAKTAGHAYELLGLLNRHSQALAFGVQTSRATYAGHPPHGHAASYGYVLAHTHAHRPFSPPASSSASGLAPLQKLCSSDSSAFRSRGEGGSCGLSAESGPKSLKFGISRILEDDFGKGRNEKGEFFIRSLQ